MGVGPCRPTVYRNATRSSTSGAALPLSAGRSAASIRQSRTRRNTPPVGQITSPRFAVQLRLVQPLSKKYFGFPELQIKLHDLPSRPERGALAIVTNVGTGSGGRGSAGAHLGSQGGFYRSVSDRGARRRTALRRTAKSCGPDASGLASSLAEVLRAQPGGQNHIREATVSNKPDHRGERAIDR